MIYLYAPTLLNLEQAEEYFRRAAKYSVVESDPEACRIANILLSENQSEDNVNTIRSLAAESYFQAGVACYAQGKFGEAAELTGRAFELNPRLLEAGFFKAKALVATGDEHTAAELVEQVVSERFYSVKVAADGDLAPSSEVKIILQKLHFEALNKAKRLISKCRENVLPNSQASALLPKFLKIVKYSESTPSACCRPRSAAAG